MDEKSTLETYADGAKKWWLEGSLHREYGPAVELIDGHKEWWFNHDIHRVGGPAIEYADGTKEWWFHGLLHRTDGPAIDDVDGTKQWWVYGIQYTYAQWKAKCNPLLIAFINTCNKSVTESPKFFVL